MSFLVVQEKYEGPFHLLLELLEKKNLEITELNIASVADDFLNYLEINEVSNNDLADFLVIASRLIYLKTKELLPFLIVEEDEEISLEDKLRVYKEFYDVAEGIEEILKKERVMFGRKLKKIKQEIVHLPPQMLHEDHLVESFDNLMKKLKPFFVLKKTSIEKIKSVSERIEELQKALVSRSNFTFNEVVAGARSRGEVVVSFLALLELVRRNVVIAKHSENHDIMIERV